MSCDVFDSFAAHAGLVYDVTDTSYCKVQNGSALGRVFATFRRRFLTNETGSRVKNCCVSIVIPSLSIGLVMVLR